MTAKPDNTLTTTFQYHPVDQAENVAHKQRVVAIMQQLIQAPLVELTDALRSAYHADARVNVTHPINGCLGLEAIDTQLWRPLRHALPDAERRDEIVAAGR
jgi:hypothetical protein